MEAGGVPWNKRLETARLIGQLLGRYPCNGGRGGGGGGGVALLDRGEQKACRHGLQALLADGHHKVSLATLRSVNEWLDRAGRAAAAKDSGGPDPQSQGKKSHGGPSAVQAAQDAQAPCPAILELLLPAAAQRLADTKSSGAAATREAARAVFDGVRDCCDAPTLVGCVTGLLVGDQTDKVKLTLAVGTPIKV